MTQISAASFNVYCDESGHLEHDLTRVMILGAVWCPLDKAREIAVRIREIKARHGLPSTFEGKWGKVSASKKAFYLDLVDYFFDDDDQHFRALIVPDKSKLTHKMFQQDHDTWYYKMYFDMLKVLLQPKAQYRIYLDIKDTRSAAKVAKLHEVLCNNLYDFEQRVIPRLQLVRSHEVEQVQLADILIGAVSYANRSLGGNEGKNSIVERVRKRSSYSLTHSTLLKEEKFNLFRWTPTADNT